MKLIYAAAAALLALPLGGCYANYAVQGSAAEVSLSGSAGALSTLLIVGVMVAAGIRYYQHGPDGQLWPLELDPSRKVSEQDCSRPLNRDGGNLRCR